MDNKTFCFIICSNDKLYTQECLYYINQLNVPDGYGIDVLTVEDARSMTAGYNEAMRCSEAKYKVYLHQDVFIINRNFMQDCLNIFHSDEQIGMIGNVGVEKMPESGIMWNVDRVGKIYEQHIYETVLSSNGKKNGLSCMEVEAIDGFLMVTQYDIPWREDLFDKWDFYDCSQSMEFIRNGYKVVVPHMHEPWCVHDSGFVNLENYEGERRKFVLEYLAPLESVYRDKKEQSMKKVSVVIPCYNVSEYLDRCMSHLIRQTIGLENIEIILVNDASTDGGATWDKIMQYEKQYPDSIIAISLDENLRQGGARNVGISYASGEYLIFCDADDWLRTEALGLLSMVMEGTKTDVVEFRYKEVYEYTGEETPIESGNRNYELEGDSMSDEKRRQLLICCEDEFGLGCMTKMYRMSMIKENNIRFAERLIFEEPSFTLPVRLYETKHVFLDMVLYYYYQKPDSTMHGNWDDKKLNNPNVWIILYEDLKKRGFLDKYPKELEYLFWSWGIGLSIRALLGRGYVVQEEELTFLKEMALKYCPDIRHNMYLSQHHAEWNRILIEAFNQEFTPDNIVRFNKSALKYFTEQNS